MARMIASNTTGKKKAVRVPGGFVVIKPGESETITAEFTETEQARYEAAGLTFKGAAGRPKAEAEAEAKTKAAEG